ncbi:MAG: serine/threonine protein kinase [Bdellovibrionales bacterium]|nr:serine/threonine protein kinase [Bdellovibrionales bacterium]
MTGLQRQIEELGRYKVLRQLGEGGMSVVFLAYDSRLQSHVALKVLKQSKKSQIPEIESKFLREARVLMGLNHPHVIRVFDLHHQSDLTFLVLEYVEGANLRQYLQSNPFLSLDDRFNIFRSISRGVQAIHQHSIVHRDLKPENILVSASGDIKIADFGIVREMSSGSEESLGTPAYMSPEQGASGVLSGRSDIYALGVMGSEIFLGRRPDGLSAVSEGAREADFVSESLSRLMAECLAPDPALRVPDVDALLRRLGEIQNPRGTERLARFFSDSIKPRVSLSILAVSILIFVSGKIMSSRLDDSKRAPRIEDSVWVNHYAAVSRCAPHCEGEYPALMDSLSRVYPALTCGDGKCSFLEGLCGLCAKDCEGSELTEYRGPRPLCLSFSRKPPSSGVRLEARKVFDQCLFRLNPDSGSDRRGYVLSLLDCLRESSNEAIRGCYQEAVGNRVPDPRASQEVISCVLKEESTD